MDGRVAEDMAGRVFGKLTVLRRAPREPGPGPAVWVCLCECGTVTTATGGNLRKGRAFSCGCVRRKHGMAGSPTWVSWRSMRDRCLNVRNPGYANYGGRGITIAERWDDFAAFLADMGERPKGLTLDRIDNDGNYEPGNCRWATMRTQSRNSRMNTLLEHQGATHTMVEWSEILGLAQSVIVDRLRRGWAVERALSTPVRSYSRS
jgi:hypothetical protein